MDLSTAQGIYLGATGVQSVYLGSTLIWPATPHDYSQDPLTFEVLEAGQFKFKYSSANTSPMRYSLDNGVSYITMQDDTWTATIPAGSKMLLDCYEPTPAYNPPSGGGTYYFGIGFFSSTGNFNVSGNIGTILEGYLAVGLDPAAVSSWPSLDIHQFHGLFDNCQHLISAEHLYLPTGTMTDFCYDGMFSGCNSLTKAPALPATTLARACYLGMFQSCWSLTTAPVLPATTLAQSCYAYMFSGCTSLTTAPLLPAPTLAERCYAEMFYNCTSLTSITCLATDISASSCTAWWVENLLPTGTFTKAASMNDWTTGDSGIPLGWTVVNAPNT